jgi:Fe-S cluster assembly ATP-binding protein
MKTTSVLKIEGLQVSVHGKAVLKGIELDLRPGEVHAIMGPNGSGKSTLAAALAGREGYDVTAGRVSFRGEDLLAMSVEERARRGLFLGFQYPVEIEGVSNLYFLRSAVNEVRKFRGEPPLDAVDFLAIAREKMKLLEFDEKFLERNLNVGFSGGEKKRNEILQMSLLEPVCAVLDETDSGLDIDALRVVAEGVNRLRSPERAILLITHYQRLLNYIRPDHVHVLAHGRIARSGDASLALELERQGYTQFAGAAR